MYKQSKMQNKLNWIIKFSSETEECLCTQGEFFDV